jgi:hypothetical protein
MDDQFPPEEEILEIRGGQIHLKGGKISSVVLANFKLQLSDMTMDEATQLREDLSVAMAYLRLYLDCDL